MAYLDSSSHWAEKSALSKSTNSYASLIHKQTHRHTQKQCLILHMKLIFAHLFKPKRFIVNLILHMLSIYPIKGLLILNILIIMQQFLSRCSNFYINFVTFLFLKSTFSELSKLYRTFSKSILTRNFLINY